MDKEQLLGEPVRAGAKGCVCVTEESSGPGVRRGSSASPPCLGPGCGRHCLSAPSAHGGDRGQAQGAASPAGRSVQPGLSVPEVKLPAAQGGWFSGAICDFFPQPHL